MRQGVRMRKSKKKKIEIESVEKRVKNCKGKVDRKGQTGGE